MSSDTSCNERVECPSCGNKGSRVSVATVRALLLEEYRDRVLDDEAAPHDARVSRRSFCNGSIGWRFCESKNCDVVYFAGDLKRLFTKEQIRVVVGVKETQGERPLCYCFGHSVASIKEELRTRGVSDAIEDIRRRMKEPGCRCETENPSGTCCLGSVAEGVDIVKAELEALEQNSEPPGEGRKHSAGKRGERIATAGTLVSALAASACCWLPLLLLAVGVSGAGIASVLEAYRPMFIVVTFGFLGAAFYIAFRPGKAAAESRDGCCAETPEESEACNKAEARRRFNVMTMNRLMLWVVTAIALGFLFLPGYVGMLLGSGSGSPATGTTGESVFSVEGMFCEGCAAIAERAIRSVPGVLEAQVDYEHGQAVVGTEACCPVPREDVLAELERAGFRATQIEARKSSAASR